MNEHIESIIRLIESNTFNDTLKHSLSQLNTADAAQALEELLDIYDEFVLLKLFRLFPKSAAAEVFSYLSIETQQQLLNLLTEKEAASIIDDLYADDAADLLEEMPSNVVYRLLRLASPETRKDINHLLKYAEDSAGSIMTVEFLDLKAKHTVSQALEKIRRVGWDRETVDNCFVLDDSRRLIGSVTLRKLVLSDSASNIETIMDTNLISAFTSTDQEDVADMFSKYDLTAMPVVDSEKRLVGIITVDDIVDIMREEATEDIEKMAAITPSEHPYLKTGIIHTFSQRIPWLLLLMISATITGNILRGFEDALAACVILTSFVPMITDTGGNAGSQAAVTIIRGLSLGEIRFRDIFKVLYKEFAVSLMCGITLSIANFVKILLIDGLSLEIAMVVSLTLIAVVIIAKLVGSSLPVLAKRLGLDPAVMASPFITTIVDALGLLVYLNIASYMLGL